MPIGITIKEADPRIIYADIIDMPHHQSNTHPRMSLYDRSAQFASYKALSGYEDMVAEEARQTEIRDQPEEYELSIINRKINLIASAIDKGEHPVITFTMFVPDIKKAGGAYADITDSVKRIETEKQQVILMSKSEISGMNKTIDFEKIVGMKGELVNYMDSLV